MRRSRRFIALTLGLGLFAGVLAAPVVAEEVSPTGDRAMAQLASCSSVANNLLVSIVVDESGSLQETDPTSQRVNGINSAIDALADLRAGAGSKLNVEANLGLFAEGYTPLVTWLPLDKANAAHLKSVSSAELPKRNRGLSTDYRAALTAARSSLNEREAKIGGTSCKVILWFTDGALDVPGRTPAALSDLCLPNGIVDSVRGSRISVIALALFHEPSSVTPAQREELRSIAEGTGKGMTCGKTPISSDAVAGAYLRADDASALRRVFAGIGARIGGASQSMSLKCPSPDCVAGVARFPVDRGIAGFQIIVDSPDNAAQLTLAGPDGKQVRLTATSTSSTWGKLKITARNGLTTVTVTFNQVDGTQVGSWLLKSVGPAGKPSPVAVDLYYFWGARLVVGAPDGVLIGQASPVKVTLTVAGRNVPPNWYKSLDVKLQVGDAPQMTLVAGLAGTFVGSVKLPAGSVPSEVAVTASVSAISAPSDIPLAPVSRSVVFPTRLPPTFPTVTPTRLVLPAITSIQGVTGILRLHGTGHGNTKVCLHEGAKLIGPQKAGNVIATADAQCVSLAPGVTREWTIRAVPDALADGQVTGQLQLDLTGEKPGDTVSISVPVRSSMARPVDEPLRWALIAVFVVLSLLIPLVLLSLANWRIGRFRLRDLTHVASVPVTVTATGVAPRRNDSAELVDVDDFHLVGQGNIHKRTFSTDGVKFAHALPWPMSDPSAFATADLGEIVLSGTGQYSDASGSRAPVVTALEQCWVLVVDPATVTKTEAQGRIVFVNDVTESTDLRAIIAARSEQFTWGGFGGWEVVWAKLTAAVEQRARTACTRSENSARTSGKRVACDAQSLEPGGAITGDAVATLLDGPPRPTIFDDDEAGLPVTSHLTGRTAATSAAAGQRGSRWLGRKTRHQEAPPPSSPGSPTYESSPQGAPARDSEDDFQPPPPLSF